MKTILKMTVSTMVLLSACSGRPTKTDLDPNSNSKDNKNLANALFWPPAELNTNAGQQVDPQIGTTVLEDFLQKHPGDAALFLVRYREAALWAKTDAARSCGIWLNLSNQAKFPLARIAYLHAVEICPLEQPAVRAFSDIIAQNQESWLREASLRAALTRSLSMQDPALTLRFAAEVAPYEVRQEDQLKLLLLASDLARKQGDASLQEQTTNQLFKLAPRMTTSPSPEQFMAIAADFRKVRNYSKAREYYRKAFAREDVDDIDRLQALDGVRMTYKLENDKSKFVQATREYSNFARLRFFKTGQRLGKYLETRLTWARAVWTENSPADALVILSKVERELRGRYPIDESLFLRARIAEESGHLEPALNILKGINDQHLNDHSQWQKVTWFRAWVTRKAGHLEEAARLFKAMIDDEESAPALARDHFWLARTLKDLNQTHAAEAEFNWLIENDPIGYYGLLAYRETAQLMPTLSVLKPSLSSSVPTPLALTSEEQVMFEWLIAASESDLARRFLDQIGVVRRSSMNEIQLLDYLQLYARTGAYQSLFARLTELSVATRRQILEENPELIFPRVWRTNIESAAAHFDLKPQLIYSIIRQESSFNPIARSPADAFGLMQLLPEVAENVARKLTEKPSSPILPPLVLSAPDLLQLRSHEDLYRPEVNIVLGSAHLRGLLDRWNGQFIPAVASYNASEAAVRRWLKTRGNRDALTFIEDIPFDETKGYVKLVMRNFVFYSRLKSDPAPIAFPEWCLSGRQDDNL